MHSCKRSYMERYRARVRAASGALISRGRARRRAQEPVLRPLLDRFFTRHEADGGGWEWSRSREQARAPYSMALQLCPPACVVLHSEHAHSAAQTAQARLTAPRGVPLLQLFEEPAALRRLASRGRPLAPAGRAARKPARAAALTAAPPRPCAQAQSLLLHVLIVALVSEGGELGAAQFERLRGALRAAPADLAGLYRCAPRRARAGDGPGRGLAGGWSAVGSGLLD